MLTPRLQQQLPDGGLRSTLITRPRRRCRRPGYSLRRPDFSICSRRRPGRPTRSSRRGSSNLLRSRRTSPCCRRCQEQGSWGQGPCRRRLRQGYGSRSRRRGCSHRPDSFHC
ncbi:hypothetical protein VPH35_014679 [Triticum aestivum]